MADRSRSDRLAAGRALAGLSVRVLGVFENYSGIAFGKAGSDPVRRRDRFAKSPALAGAGVAAVLRFVGVGLRMVLSGRRPTLVARPDYSHPYGCRAAIALRVKTPPCLCKERRDAETKDGAPALDDTAVC